MKPFISKMLTINRLLQQSYDRKKKREKRENGESTDSLSDGKLKRVLHQKGFKKVTPMGSQQGSSFYGAATLTNKTITNFNRMSRTIKLKQSEQESKVLKLPSGKRSTCSFCKSCVSGADKPC